MGFISSSETKYPKSAFLLIIWRRWVEQSNFEWNYIVCSVNSFRSLMALLFGQARWAEKLTKTPMVSATDMPRWRWADNGSGYAQLIFPCCCYWQWRQVSGTIVNKTATKYSMSRSPLEGTKQYQSRQTAVPQENTCSVFQIMPMIHVSEIII